MLKTIVRLAAALLLLPGAAAAEPIKLKLSFFSSDRSITYVAAIKPFVDAVNAGAKGLLEIEPHVAGEFSRDLTQQPQLIRDGVADIAYVVPGVTRNEFNDNTIIEMPGLYRDMREATTVFTRLIAANALRGYEDYFVIGAYVTDPATFHCRVPVSAAEDLRGKRIRANNPVEITALEKLGAIPVLMQVNQIAESLSSGKLDCAIISPSPLSDYGIKRVATYHYFLGTGGAPLMLLMSRKSFDALPTAAQDIIRKHSGEWIAEHFIRVYAASEGEIVAQLHADSQRTLIMPSEDDLQKAHTVFATVMNEWVAKDPRNQAILQAAESEIKRLRAGE